MKKLILFAALMMAAVAGANAQSKTEPMPKWFTALAARGVSSEWLLLGTGDMLTK